MGNKKVKTRELKPYYLQHTNRKLLGMPIWLWIYQLGRWRFNKKAIKKRYAYIVATYDKKIDAVADDPVKKSRLEREKKKKLEAQEALLKNGNFLMREGEAPVIYTSQKQTSTENNLLQYLHTKGYFNAQVNSKLVIKDKKAYVIYKITENQPFIIKDISLHSADKAIKKLLEPYEQHSLIKRSKRYDQDVLAAERERIYELLLNNGYWGFNKQYIAFNVDITNANYLAVIETVISLPVGERSHQVYHLDSTEFSILDKTTDQQDEKQIIHSGIIFRNIKKHFSPRLIATKIPLQQGQIYKKCNIIEARKRLTNLNVFKDIHVSYDTIDKRNLKTFIHTSLLDKFQFEQEIGTQFAAQSSILPFYEVSLKTRNLLKQLELITLKGNLSVETGSLNMHRNQLYSVQNFQLGCEIDLPGFSLPLSEKMHTKLGAYNPHTKMHASYSITNRNKKYKTQDIKTFLSYGWHPSKRVTCEIIPFSVRVTDFDLTPKFIKHLHKQGPNSNKDYNSAVLTYSSIKTTFESLEEHKKDYSYLELLVESGGTLQNLIDFEHMFGTNFSYYKYLKFNLTYSQHIPIQVGTVFAYHVDTGIIYPYGANKTAPITKCYYIGGQSSIRAWGARDLGPGSYRSGASDKAKFYEDNFGELLLQANLEIRQHLIRFVEGAAFVDIGNIWRLHKSQKEDAEFNFKKFYKQMAIGMGVGVRLNFNFLILRLDIGFKLYDPAQPFGSRFLPETMAQPNINLALGYPF